MDVNPHGCTAVPPADDWAAPPLPGEIRTGQLIRHREIFVNGDRRTRLGGMEPKVIVAETRDYVIYRIWAYGGRDLGEKCLPRDEFEAKFERGPMTQYVDFEDTD